MPWHDAIDPGSGHTTIIDFDEEGPHFQIFSVKHKEEKKKAKPKKGDKDKGGDKKDSDGGGHVPIFLHPKEWELPFPNVVAPNAFVVIRSFENLNELITELPIIELATKQLLGSHKVKPTAILAFPHKGLLKPADVKIIDQLREAGIDPVLVVSHQS